MSVLTEVRAVLEELGTLDISPQRRLGLLKDLPRLAGEIADSYEDLGRKVEVCQKEVEDLRRSLAQVTGDSRWIDPGPIVLAASREAGAVVR